MHLKTLSVKCNVMLFRPHCVKSSTDMCIAWIDCVSCSEPKMAWSSWAGQGQIWWLPLWGSTLVYGYLGPQRSLNRGKTEHDSDTELIIPQQLIISLVHKGSWVVYIVFQPQVINKWDPVNSGTIECIVPQWWTDSSCPIALPRVSWKEEFTNWIIPEDHWGKMNCSPQVIDNIFHTICTQLYCAWSWFIDIILYELTHIHQSCFMTGFPQILMDETSGLFKDLSRSKSHIIAKFRNEDVLKYITYK